MSNEKSIGNLLPLPKWYIEKRIWNMSKEKSYEPMGSFVLYERLKIPLSSILAMPDHDDINDMNQRGRVIAVGPAVKDLVKGDFILANSKLSTLVDAKKDHFIVKEEFVFAKGGALAPAD